MEERTPGPNDQYLRSSFYEQLVEHTFISELLQEAWYRHGRTIEVLRSEVDSAGYDLVLEAAGVVRHVQLKTSAQGAARAEVNVNIALADKPCGCVVWVIRNEDKTKCRMALSYLFYGGVPGAKLDKIGGLKVAKHTKGNAAGKKNDRPAIRRLQKSKFKSVPDTTALLAELFGWT